MLPHTQWNPAVRKIQNFNNIWNRLEDGEGISVQEMELQLQSCGNAPGDEINIPGNKHTGIEPGK